MQLPYWITVVGGRPFWWKDLVVLIGEGPVRKNNKQSKGVSQHISFLIKMMKTGQIILTIDISSYIPMSGALTTQPRLTDSLTRIAMPFSLNLIQNTDVDPCEIIRITDPCENLWVVKLFGYPGCKVTHCRPRARSCLHEAWMFSATQLLWTRIMDSI